MRYYLLGFILFTGIIIMSCQSNAELKPPVADKIPHSDTLFNDVRIDNYHWLRDRNNPKVIEYLKAENAYTEAKMKHTKKLQNTLYKEMVSRIKQTDLSVPVKYGPYYYYTRTEKGLQYPIYCRKKGSLKAEEEILLDQNTLAKGHKFFSIGVFAVSPNHRYLAYSTDTTGSETYTIQIKDLKTGQLFPEKIPNTYYSMAWANDNRTFFYTVLDDAKRPYKLFM